MGIYLIAFAVSSILLWFSQKTQISSVGRSLLTAAALLILILLAGLRADTVGTDTTVYADKLYFQAEMASSLKEYFKASWYQIWRYLYVSDYEYGFSVLVYAVTKLTHSFPCVLSAIAAFVVVPVYYALKEWKSEISIWLGMLVFDLMFFNISLNLMRQMIATSFCLLAYSCLIHEKRKSYLFWNLTAILFHKTAVLGFVVSILYLFIVRCSSHYREHPVTKGYILKFGRLRTTVFGTRALFITLAAVCSLAAVPLVMAVVRAMGRGYYVSGTFTLMPKQLLLRIPLLLPLLMSAKRMRNQKSLYWFLFVLQIVEMVISQLAGLSEQTIRICYYLSILQVLAVPYLCSLWKKTNHIVMELYYVSYLIAYWIFFFVISGTAQTVPYLFR